MSTTTVPPLFGWGATPEQVSLLSAATPPAEVKKRKGPGGIDLSYIDARFVQDRFDYAVGPANWARKHKRDVEGNVTCGVGVLVRYDEKQPPEWVWKWDVGSESTIESLKGQYSDSFKRAAVNWGCGRDLYDETSEARVATAGPSFRPAGPVAPPVGAVRAAHMDPDPDPSWVCPVHGGRRVVPAGISKTSGKPYPAFAVCSESGCDEKPARGRAPRPVGRTPNPVYAGIGEELP